MWSDNPLERITVRILILGFLFFVHWLLPESAEGLVFIPVMLCLSIFSLEFIGGFIKLILRQGADDPEDNAGWGIWIILIAGFLLFIFYE